MADQIRATPRNSLAALLSDAINSGVGYMKDPRRTQQLQGLGRLIESTGIPYTVESLSYDPSGRGLFTGAGGLGGTTRMRPQALEAAMTVAPFVAPANRALMQATKGLPVGASIQNVGKSASQSIVREGNPIQSAVVLIGDRIFTGRTHTEAFNRAIYEGVIRKEGNKFIYPKDAEINSDLFMTKDGQIIDRFQASKMFDIGASETAIKEGLMQNKPASSMSVDSYIEQANKIKKQKESKSAPRQEALDTAQRNAALPVEKGGLGLPKDNTPEMRAEAMGAIDAVHFSRRGGDYTELDSGKFAIAPFDAVGTHVGTPQAAMERFQNTVGYKVNNPNYALDELTGSSYPVKVLGDKPLLNQNGMPWGEDDLNIFLRQSGGYNWSDVNGGKLTYQDLNADLRKKLFEQQGYTSIPYFNEVEGKGSISYIVPPENIRSRFAAFDPMRRSAAIAAAMGLAAPDLLANQAPVNPMYQDPFPDTTR
jgi:hypothetical protein